MAVLAINGDRVILIKSLVSLNFVTIKVYERRLHPRRYQQVFQEEGDTVLKTGRGLHRP